MEEVSKEKVGSQKKNVDGSTERQVAKREVAKDEAYS